MSRGYTIQQIRAIHWARGGYFFDEGNMRAFSSRASDKVYSGPGGVYFVTSEKLENWTCRCYTVRRFVPETGEVKTVGDFRAYEKRQHAHRAAQRLADWRRTYVIYCPERGTYLGEPGRDPARDPRAARKWRTPQGAIRRAKSYRSATCRNAEALELLSDGSTAPIGTVRS